MIGIVWYNKLLDGQEKLKQIVQDYEKINVNTIQYILGSNNNKVSFDNGDTWYACPAKENQRGHRCNISYIDRTIDPEIIANVIKPITKMPPYAAFKYYWPNSISCVPEEEL